MSRKGTIASIVIAFVLFAGTVATVATIQIVSPDSAEDSCPVVPQPTCSAVVSVEGAVAGGAVAEPAAEEFVIPEPPAVPLPNGDPNMSARNIRNLNPGNIIHSSKMWAGMADVQGDSRFVQFRSAEFGFLAMHENLRYYVTLHGLKTINEWMARWSPVADTGNRPDLYARSVSAVLGIHPDDPRAAELLHTDPLWSHTLMQAMARHEAGSSLPADWPQAALDAARSSIAAARSQ